MLNSICSNNFESIIPKAVIISKVYLLQASVNQSCWHLEIRVDKLSSRLLVEDLCIFRIVLHLVDSGVATCEQDGFVGGAFVQDGHQEIGSRKYLNQSN